MESQFQIDEAEASREIYRVHLPGAENDLCSLRELRQLALSKVITPGTLISKEGGNVQTPARSIPSVFSHRSTRVALALWFIGLEQLYLGDRQEFFIRCGLMIPSITVYGLTIANWTDMTHPQDIIKFFSMFYIWMVWLPIVLTASMAVICVAFYWLKSGFKLVTRTAVDREGHPLLD